MRGLKIEKMKADKHKTAFEIITAMDKRGYDWVVSG
jgi:hypothetical protein